MSGGSSSNTNTVEPVSSGIKFQTSIYGSALPIVYGRTRVSGNLIWYGDFTPIAHTQTTSSSSGKGGGSSSTSTTISWTYNASFALAICEGVVASLGTIWSGKTKISSSDVIVADAVITDSSGSKSGYPTQNSPKAGAAVGGGTKGMVSTSSTMALYRGLYPQVTWPYLDSKHPDQSLNYQGVAYLAAANYDLGTSDSLPAFSFEIVAPYANAAFGYLGANPKDIVLDLLQNIHYGACFPAAKISSLTNYANYCGAMGLYLSPNYSDPQAAASMLTDLAQITNSGFYFSEGVLKVVPYGDENVTGNGYTYTAPSSTIINLTDDDFLIENVDDDPITIKRNAIPTTGNTTSDAYNQVTVEYLNSDSEYNPEICSVQDQAAIDTFGIIPMDTITAHQITSPTVAHAAASLILQRSVYIRNQYEFRLGWNYAFLEPTDIVTVTDSALGLSYKPVRILIVEEDELGTLTITAEDAPPGAASRVVKIPASGTGYSANYNLAVDNVLQPVFFEPPVDLTTGVSNLEVWVGVTGTTGDTKWGGADVYVSYDGSTYKFFGRTTAPARLGHLTATMADPAAVQLDGLGGQLIGGSVAGAQALATLSCVVDSTPEFFAYTTATLTGANAYNLSGLIRGAYGYPNASHASGAKFIRVDDAILQSGSIDPSMIGKPMYFKFCSFNIWGGGTQDISQVSPYTYTPTGSALAAYAATWNPSLSGFSVVAINNVVQFSWSIAAYKNVAGYEIRQGSTWSTATVLATGLQSSVFSWQPTTTGSLTFMMKAIIAPGVYSVNAATATLAVNGPSVTNLNHQVIDNNVLLSWTNVAGTYYFDHAEVRRGTTFATATVIGKLSGSFTTIFETASGTYKYWVVGVDSSGLYGTEVGVYVVVNQPPDYVLRSQGPLLLTGTATNVVIQNGQMIAPMNKTETYQQHFTTNGYASPQAQVTAGKTYFPQPVPSSGSYVETIDYGATIPAMKITLSLTRQVIVGDVTVTPTIQTSLDNATWTTFSGVYEAFAPTFRYVKISITFTSVSGGFLVVSGSMVRLDSKMKTISGMGNAVSTDSGGTAVDITGKFIDVNSINVTPQGTSSLVAIYDFVDTGNPTSFKVLIFNQAGARVSAPFSYTIEGI